MATANIWYFPSIFVIFVMFVIYARNFCSNKIPAQVEILENIHSNWTDDKIVRML